MCPQLHAGQSPRWSLTTRGVPSLMGGADGYSVQVAPGGPCGLWALERGTPFAKVAHAARGGGVSSEPPCHQPGCAQLHPHCSITKQVSRVPFRHRCCPRGLLHGQPGRGAPGKGPVHRRPYMVSGFCQVSEGHHLLPASQSPTGPVTRPQTRHPRPEHPPGSAGPHEAPAAPNEIVESPFKAQGNYLQGVS